MSFKAAKRGAIILFTLMLSACAAEFRPAGPAIGPAVMEANHWRAVDGLSLPMRSWQPPGRPRAVVLAVHGMNDYSNAFDGPGKYLASKGVAVYAYDQRGFGAAPEPGYWAGEQSMAADLREAAALVADRHPGIPLYLLGESMGGAVVIVTVANDPPPQVRGIILSAPAVWGRSTMNVFERVMLWSVYQVAPGMTLTGRGLKITPSDNIEMLRALSRDPLIIKGTRVDAIHGLVDLMDDALDAAPRVKLPALVLYGEKDEIVPPEPTWRWISGLPSLSSAQKPALYDQGYHMLLRDLQANVVLDDIAAWIDAPGRPLPSGADQRAINTLKLRTSGEAG